MNKLALVLVLAAGCAASGIGDPCIPEMVPVNGFNPAEASVEISSAQCATSVCVVYGLQGDPRANCTGDRCSAPPDVLQHVYCSCQCAGGANGSPECACPEGFSCQDVPLRGSYCVRD